MNFWTTNKSSSKMLFKHLDLERKFILKSISRLDYLVDTNRPIKVPYWRNQLLEYASIDFLNEERIAEYYLNDWPLRSELNRQHLNFWQFLDRDEHFKSPELLLHFLKNWLTHHIDGIDMEMLMEFQRRCVDSCTEYH